MLPGLTAINLSTSMKYSLALLGTASVALAAIMAQAAETPEQLVAEAKVSQADAQKTALAKVPAGTVQSSELEREHGRLIWSFDIARPKTKSVTEVNVDAKTGKVVALHVETPAKEAREAAAEKAEPKPKVQ